MAYQSSIQFTARQNADISKGGRRVRLAVAGLMLTASFPAHAATLPDGSAEFFREMKEYLQKIVPRKTLLP